MRILTFILLFILSTDILGQVTKIKIKRAENVDSTFCDFKFTADTSLINKTYRLEKFAFKCEDKMSNKIAEEIRTKLGRPMREKQYYISRPSVAEFVKNACEVKKFVLQKVEVKQGSDIQYIVLIFTYKKKTQPDKN